MNDLPKLRCGGAAAMTCTAYNDTSVQPQSQAMGAACSERAGGEIPMTTLTNVGPRCSPRQGYEL